MHVLVTRPRADAEPFVGELAARGHTALVEPMFTVRHHASAVDLTGVQAVLFTSANGVRALAAATPVRGVRVLAVGHATAAEAEAHGFARVERASGDAESLAALVRDRLDPANGALYHAAGTVTRGALAETLDRAGFSVRREAVYAAEPVDALSEPAQRELAEGTLDAAAFFSPRTAATFVSVTSVAHLAAACRALDAVCLSPVVAERVRALPWRAVHVADTPDREALHTALAAAAAARKANRRP